jgi:phosphatidylinositol alpha 1,6-mannosyltransferase
MMPSRQPETLRAVFASESPLGKRNGVTNSQLQLLPEFKDQGHDIRFISPKPANDSYEGFSVVKTESVNVPFYDFRLGIPTPGLVERVIDDFRADVVYAASPYLLGARAIRVASHRQIACVANQQSSIEGFADTTLKRLLKNKVAGDAAVDGFGKHVIRRTERMFNLATLALAPSASARNDLLRYGVKTPIELWGRGVDGMLFHPNKKLHDEAITLKKEWSNDGEKVIVMCVGRLSPEKTIERLSALEGLGVQVVVVGKGKKKYVKMLRSVLPKGAIFTGELSGEALAHAVAAADISIHTGVKDTYGQVIQEAMAAGNPVIVPNAGGPAEIVKHGVTGLVYDIDDESALPHSVAQLRDNSEMRRAMGHRGREEMKDKTWRHFAGLLIGHLYDAYDMNEYKKSSR